jgi:ABC-type sugar transport system substrate-binding protein
MQEKSKAMDINEECCTESKSTSRWPVKLRSLYWVLSLGTLGMGLGCDSSSFVPSRPPELATSTTSPYNSAPAAAPSAAAAGTSVAATEVVLAVPKTARARMVELLLARPPELDRSYLEQFLRRYSGLKKCAFRAVKPQDAPMTPEHYASEIRAAANRSTGALVLEPIDSPEVLDALREAVSRGLGIVLLDSPLPATPPAKFYPYVTFDGFTEAAKQIVQIVAEDAKSMRLPADGTILLLENREKDHYSRYRLESITDALKAAGRAYDQVSFGGLQEGAGQAVLGHLEAHPKVTIILADDEFGVAGAFEAKQKWLRKNHAGFAIAGYAACDARMADEVKRNVQGLADRNIEGYAQKVVQIAVDLMEARPVSEGNIVNIPIVHTPPPLAPPPVTPKPTSAERKAVGER